MKAHLIPTTWIRVVAAAALATPMALALGAVSGDAALQYDGGELTRFEIDGDAVPGVGSAGSPANGFVLGDWGHSPADYGYGPQAMGVGTTDPAPTGIGSTGVLPTSIADSRGDDFPIVSPAPNPQYPTVPGSIEFCPEGEDDNWEGGAKVQSLVDIDDPLTGPGGTLNLGCGQTLDKGDLFRAYAAYEIVAIPNVYGDPSAGSQQHTILYGAWERGEFPGELNFYIPVADAVPGNSAGDRLIAFDYDSSAPAAYRVLFWNGAEWVVGLSGNAGDMSSTFQAAVGFADGSPFGAKDKPTFGEFALDLTAAGVLPDVADGECLDLTTAGYIFTETGNSANAQLKDFVLAPRLPIGNCGPLDVVKTGPEVAASPAFAYRVEQQDGAAIFPTSTLPAGQDEYRIDDFLAIGETDQWVDLYAQPDYLVYEPQPLVTDPASPGWSQQLVTCTYVDAFATGFPIVTETLYLGTEHLPGAFVQVQSDAFLELAGRSGFVPSCEITNDAAGVIVEKAGAGDAAQTFALDVNGQDVQLAIGELAFVPFEEGTPVTITEQPIVGADPTWDLTSIDCYHAGTIEPYLTITDGDTVTVEARASRFVDRCVFTNVQRGTITIEKTATPDLGATFDFESSLGGFRLGDGDVVTFSDVVAGSYTFDESELLGWSIAGLECTSAHGTSVTEVDLIDGRADVTLAGGDAVTCRYANAADTGDLTVAKAIIGDVDPSLPWSFGFELATGETVVDTGTISGVGGVPNGTLTFTGLTPGTTYTLTEDPVPGWSADAPVCAVTAPGAEPVATAGGSFTVAPGSSVTCTFENSPLPADLTVEKVITGSIDPSLAWAFGFELAAGEAVVDTGTISGVGTVPAGDLIFTGLVPGATYTLTESDTPAGWGANGATCTVTLATGESISTESGTFTVLPGSSVACAFENSPEPGSITIGKTTEGGDGEFTFALAAESGPPLEVVVTTEEGAGSATVGGLVPGATYTVTEIDPGDQWIAGDLVCTVEHADGSTTLADAAGFRVLPGDAVACGMTNTELGMIVVDKVTLPASATTVFDFVLTGDDSSETLSATGPGSPAVSGYLPPGSYTLTELDEPGWVFQGATCDGVAVGGDTATIELEAGTTVTCTFTNARHGPLTITKTVTAGPTRVAFDTYELTYRVVVTSQSYVAETYDLADVVRFGDGVEVRSASATGPAGVALVAGWNGTTATQLVDDATIGPLATHVYTVRATGEVAPTAIVDALDCVLTIDETGTGFLNESTVTWSAGSATDDDCRPAPEPEEADLAIVKTASVGTTGPDGAFDWQLEVTNLGPRDAVGLVVGDLVPTAVTVTGVSSADFTCTHAGNTVSCTRPLLAVGESGEITISVVVPGDAVEGSVTNVGTVVADTPDPDLTNNSDDAVVDIVVQLAPTTTTAILPATGSNTSSPIWSGTLLVLLGSVVLVAVRRRRNGATT